MENQFLDVDIDDRRKCPPGMRSRRGHGDHDRGHGYSDDDRDDGYSEHHRGNGNGYGSSPTMAVSQAWATTFAAQDRALVILIENGGIDLGVPALVDKLWPLLPGASLLPDSLRAKLVEFIGGKIRGLTDNLLESVELAANRYTAAKPDLFGDVTILRDSTASYDDLKNKLFGASRDGKIVDLLILTHGSDDFISVTGGINSQKIRGLKTENGRPLPLRSVYMMNCVGSSLNQAWIDAGAKVSSGALHNNYLPEPTTFFFWNAWKSGQSFESAVTSAYRKTINLMKDAASNFLSSVPGASVVAGSLDFENFDFVKDSAPVIQGLRSVTINTDDLSFTQSVPSSSLATTVLPIDLLRSFRTSRAASAERQPRTLSPSGVDFIKQWEGFRSDLYNDPAGHCTIGYGTLVHTGNCDGRGSEQPYAAGVSAENAAQLLARDAARFQQVINDSVTVALGQNQNDALVSFVYNVGGDAFKTSTLLRLLNQGSYDSVPVELKKWTKARQNGGLVDMPGLVKRRAAEADLFQKADTATAQSFALFARSFGVIDYSIPGLLPVIAQPTPNTCWAAVFTMMYSWKTNTSIAIADALAKTGAKYLDMFQRDIALDTATAKKLYDDAGLQATYSFNPSIDGWVAFLRKYGPLYVDVGYNAQNAGTHAIIVTGISGDGSPDGSSITYVDPIGGTTTTLNFRDFLAKYEAKTAVQWPYTIVHWPLSVQPSLQNSFSLTHSFRYFSPSSMAIQQSGYSYAQNPAAVAAGIEIADAAQIGLGAVAVIQAQVSASQGSFTLSFDKAQRLLTNEARQSMPGAQKSKKSYSQHLLYLDTGKVNGAQADVIIEWEGNDYGEIGTPNIRRNLSTSTEWSKSSANTTITRLDRIPLPKTDPRTWPIVYSYEGTLDPYGNGYFEFSGEFELNAFGGLKFNRHEVVSRSLLDFAVLGKPEEYVQKGRDIVVPVPSIPQEQIAYLRTKLP